MGFGVWGLGFRDCGLGLSPASYTRAQIGKELLNASRLVLLHTRTHAHVVVSQLGVPSWGPDYKGILLSGRAHFALNPQPSTLNPKP